MHDFLLVTVAYRNVESETCWSVEKAHQAGLDNFMWIITGGDALIGRSRSHVLTQFVRTEGMPPHFIFLDSDIVFEPEDLHRIAQDLKAGYDIIGGDYAVKSGMQSANYAYNGEYESDGKIHEIQFLSTGFMGISHRAAKDIAEKLNLPLLHVGTGHECYPFFESGYCHVTPETIEEQGELYISEDWDFCEKARKAGYKVYLDTAVRLGHKGVQIVTMEDVIKKQATMNSDLPVLCMVALKNYGDMLNLPICAHYIGNMSVEQWDMVDGSKRLLLGTGTLIDYFIPASWFEDKNVILLGTGATDDVKINGSGFVRGKITEARTGIKALGDIGILIDRIWDKPQQRDKTSIVIKKTKKKVETDLPNPDHFHPGVTQPNDLQAIYNRIGESSYVITDSLHVACTAESLHIPWIIWNHGERDLAQTPDKFLDWAGMIGKERFVISDIKDWRVIHENTDFSQSEKQKDILEVELKRISKELALPRAVKTTNK